ncbi:MAG: glycosyltransferase family 2 protein [Candidatus Sericytochromatia bacterium]|nr:glycosyltransferase family 2 protein [Candidatus Sericytochromatia bacterium]
MPSDLRPRLDAARTRVSVVAPCFDEEEGLPALKSRVISVLEALGSPWEFILVDDGSRDRTFELMRDFAAADSRIKTIGLSRNFGHQIAATAGLDHATGDAIILIDADLQDPPELIPEMISLWRQGWDVVYAQRRTRFGETAFKRWTAQAFYRILKRLTNVHIPVDTGDFRLMDRQVVDALRRLPERHRFLRGLVSWVGFRQTGLLFDRAERHSGTTKYPLRKMIAFALDGLTGFSFVPLQVASWLGVWVSLAAFLAICWVLWETLVQHGTVPGWSSLMVAILFIGGVQLLTIGLIGEYIGRILDEVRQRPLYFVREQHNLQAAGGNLREVPTP